MFRQIHERSAMVHGNIMKLIQIIALTLICSFSVGTVLGANPASIPTPEKSNTVCPVSGKPVNPKITMTYEGLIHSFAEPECLAKWKAARENSLYQKLGGKAAIDAAVEAFYVKVLADQRVKHFFGDINMNKQRRKQKESSPRPSAARFPGRARTCALRTPISQV